MSDTSSNLGLPYLAAAQAQKHITVNEALLRLDALVQGNVISRTVTAEPVSPSDGALYILPAGKTGTHWGGFANHALAYYRDGVWEPISPREGWLVFVRDTDAFVWFDGAAWQSFSPENGRIVGEIANFAGASAPALWLLCYGQAVSRTTYAALFTAIGVAYGAGDGSTTFNLPDLRGRVSAGKDNMGGSAAGRLTNSGTGNPGINGSTLGTAGGSDRHTLTTAQLPAHNHSITDPGHAHTVAWAKGGGGLSNIALDSPGSSGTTAVSAATTGITIQNTGGGDAHPIVQPTLVLNKIIYAGV